MKQLILITSMHRGVAINKSFVLKTRSFEIFSYLLQMSINKPHLFTDITQSKFYTISRSFPLYKVYYEYEKYHS